MFLRTRSSNSLALHVYDDNMAATVLNITVYNDKGPIVSLNKGRFSDAQDFDEIEIKTAKPLVRRSKVRYDREEPFYVKVSRFGDAGVSLYIPVSDFPLGEPSYQKIADLVLERITGLLAPTVFVFERRAKYMGARRLRLLGKKDAALKELDRIFSSSGEVDITKVKNLTAEIVRIAEGLNSEHTLVSSFSVEGFTKDMYDEDAMVVVVEV